MGTVAMGTVVELHAFYEGSQQREVEEMCAITAGAVGHNVQAGGSVVVHHQRGQRRIEVCPAGRKAGMCSEQGRARVSTNAIHTRKSKRHRSLAKQA